MTVWTDAVLEPLRYETDPLADNAVAAVFRSGHVDAVNRLLRALVDNDDITPECLPPEVKHLVSTPPLPPWADPARIRIGQAFFGRHVWLAITILHCASLPFCYAAAKGSQILYMTHRMEKQPRRRIVETAQFVMDVMDSGGLDPACSDGRGIRSAQKVRLIHAAVRHHLERYPTWSSEEFGKPINQEDLAGTLLAFSWIVLDCLDKLQINITQEEKDAYLHTWSVAGHFLGIRDELLFHTEAEARALAAAITRRQFRTSESGRQLTKALVEYVESVCPTPLFEGLPSALIRFFLGDDIADLLAVRQTHLASYLVRPLRAACRIGDTAGRTNHEFAGVFDRFSRGMLWALLLAERKGKHVSFRIPRSLRDSPTFPAWGEDEEERVFG
jgi:hypothetical protein